MNLADVTRRLFAQFDLTIKRFEFPNDNPIDVLSLLVDTLLARGRELFVVEIGANDGSSDDPVAEIVRSHRLRALMVEPLAPMFALLKDFYRDYPEVACENCAIGTEDGVSTLWQVRPDPSLPEYVRRLASFNRKVILKQRRTVPNIAAFIEPTKVPCMRFQTLLDKHNVRSIDVLLVDTEGFDFEILKMLWATPLRPTIINFEIAHLSQADKLACAQLLRREGYRYLQVGRADTLAFRHGEEAAQMPLNSYSQELSGGKERQAIA